jgi:hypothetical protein
MNQTETGSNTLKRSNEIFVDWKAYLHIILGGYQVGYSKTNPYA